MVPTCENRTAPIGSKVCKAGHVNYAGECVPCQPGTFQSGGRCVVAARGGCAGQYIDYSEYGCAWEKHDNLKCTHSKPSPMLHRFAKYETLIASANNLMQSDPSYIRIAKRLCSEARAMHPPMCLHGFSYTDLGTSANWLLNSELPCDDVELHGTEAADSTYWKYVPHNCECAYTRDPNDGTQIANSCREVSSNSNDAFISTSGYTCLSGTVANTLHVPCSDQYGVSTFWSRCASCPNGKFCTQKTNSTDIVCASCPLGTRKIDGATRIEHACVPCPAGTYSDVANAAKCVPCPSGTFSYGGAEGCTPCPDGHYQPHPQSSYCTMCPAGTASGLDTKIACIDCLIDYYSPQSASVACTKCDSSKHTAGYTGMRACMPRPDDDDGISIWLFWVVFIGLVCLCVCLIVSVLKVQEAEAVERRQRATKGNTKGSTTNEFKVTTYKFEAL